jgi:hypothetical protein
MRLLLRQQLREAIYEAAWLILAVMLCSMPSCVRHIAQWDNPMPQMMIVQQRAAQLRRLPSWPHLMRLRPGYLNAPELRRLLETRPQTALLAPIQATTAYLYAATPLILTH